MNKALSTQEVEQLTAAALPATMMATMTRREKLMRWAAICRKSSSQFMLYHNLEHYPPHDWDAMVHPGSAFAAAAADPILKDAGLKSGSVGDAQRFFELSRDDLHAFSCDCGGAISNADMANRLETVAKRDPATPSSGMLQGMIARLRG